MRKRNQMMLCERHNVMYLSSCNKCQSESADTIEQLTKERDKLKSDIQEMVRKAASKHRPAYDEQQQRISVLTEERDDAIEALSGFKPKVDGRKHSHTYSDGIISRAARVLAKHNT